MNNKKFKQLIQSKVEKIEVKDFTAEILNSTSHQILPSKEKEKSKLWVLPLTSSIVIATSMAICIPLGLFDNGSGKGDKLEVSKAEMVLSRELLALGNVLVDNKNVNTLKKQARRSKDTTINYQKIAEDCNYYLLTGDAFIYQEDINVEYQKNNDKNYSSYQFKMNVSYIDHKQYEVSYLSYFNQNEISKNKIEIEGIFLIDNKEYPLFGEENKNNEEVELELKIFTEENSYISISNETEINENEYEYKYVEDGKLVKGVEFSYEVENGRKETEITIIENNSTVSYGFEYFDDTIECEYEFNSLEVEIEIYVHNDYYLYLFEDKTQIKLNKK
jgi:hypothetical protein